MKYWSALKKNLKKFSILKGDDFENRIWSLLIFELVSYIHDGYLWYRFDQNMLRNVGMRRITKCDQQTHRYLVFLLYHIVAGERNYKKNDDKILYHYLPLLSSDTSCCILLLAS